MFKTSEKVFNPAHYLTLKHMELISSHIVPGDSLLDVGTGTGILALTGLQCGASKVTATDISEDAIELAKQNIVSNHAEISVVNTHLNWNIEGVYNIISANLEPTQASEFTQYAMNNMNADSILFLSWFVEFPEEDITRFYQIMDHIDFGKPFSIYVLKLK